MPILPSAGKRIHELLARLSSAIPAERESAVARLTLLGPRILAHLPGFLAKATLLGRLGVLEVLERWGASTDLGPILALTRDRHEEVARRAIELAAAFPDARTAEALTAVLASGSPVLRASAAKSLSRLHGLGLVEAVDPLLRLLFDGNEEDSLRLTALEALSALERRALRPALRRLAGDRSPAVVRAAEALGARLVASTSSDRENTTEPAPPSPHRLLDRLTSSRTPSSEVPDILQALVSPRSPSLPLLLKATLDELDREAKGRGTEAVARAKARLHLALGALDSRIALHDLRELLARRPPYAVRDLLVAAEQVGDASLLPALAALAADEPPLLAPTGKAFRAIAGREKLRRGSKAIRSLRPRQRSALEPLWPQAPHSRARGRRPGPRGT